MSMFDKAKNMYRLQKQAKKIKKDLTNTHIEAEVDGVIVVINGQQEIVSVTIPPDMLNSPAHKEKIEDALVKAFNKAVKKSQQIAAGQMKEVMQEMGLGGM